MRLNILRKKYPQFIYRNYDYKVIKGNLKISFFFEIPPDIRFRPQIAIKSVLTSGVRTLDNLVFHVGLMEMLSYWKTTCSPEIVIEAGCLDDEQIKWWKNLIIKSMGQFFYENKIDWHSPNFLGITSLRIPDVRKPIKVCGRRVSAKLKGGYLVPFAGGRDSIVTLEGLKKHRKEITLFTVNPVAKIQRAVRVSGIKKQIIIKRIIDKKLLELNRAGYLNGHTPFTSLLSFLSVLCAILFDYRNIAFSNEKSANEGNVKYLGAVINHQWAKSYEFEKMFRYYCRKYLAKNINYFSFTRKYGELEISKIFLRYLKYFSVFSSCNAGMRIGNKGMLLAKKRWCGKCPKCLFVYLTLCPYLKEEQLLKIFGSNFLKNKKLLPILNALMGKGDHKPFECVGTYKESKKAFYLSLEKARKSGKIPYLLKIVKP